MTGSFASGRITCDTLPESACADGPLPEHERLMRFGLLRLDLGVGIGLGKGLQLAFTLPLELKRFTLQHRLLDGTPYEVPYAMGTGPSETSFGLTDSRLLLRIAGGPKAKPVVFSAGLGAALPTGTPSGKDPFDPTVPAAQRQHRRSGNGTVDPLLELGFVVRGWPFGFFAWGSTRVPVYANPDGYRGSWQLGGSLGLLVTPPDPLDDLRLILGAELTHVGPASWQGEPERNSGRDSVGVRLGFEWRVRPLVALQGGLTVLPLETWAGDQFPLPVTGRIGISGTIDLKKKPGAKADPGHH